MPVRDDVGDLIAFLDSVAKLDPVAVGRLIAYRVPCAEALREHPSVQVGDADETLPGKPGIPVGVAAEFAADRKPGVSVVGILGILNGYAGTIDDGPRKGWGPIAADTEDDGSVTGFRRTWEG